MTVPGMGSVCSSPCRRAAWTQERSRGSWDEGVQCFSSLQGHNKGLGSTRGVRGSRKIPNLKFRSETAAPVRVTFLALAS